MTKSLAHNSDRLRAIFARIDSGDEGADIAFGKATNALRDAGISWSDLLEAHLRSSSSPEQAKAMFDDAFAGIFNNSIFSDMANRAKAPPKANITVSGEDIPAEIRGVIEEVDRRKTRNGEMLVVTVSQDDGSVATKYGPLVIFNSPDIATFDAFEPKHFSGHVTKASKPHLYPKLHTLRLQ